MRDILLVLFAVGLIAFGFWGRRSKLVKPRGRMSDAWRAEMLHNGWRDRGRR